MSEGCGDTGVLSEKENTLKGVYELTRYSPLKWLKHGYRKRGLVRKTLSWVTQGKRWRIRYKETWLRTTRREAGKECPFTIVVCKIGEQCTFSNISPVVPEPSLRLCRGGQRSKGEQDNNPFPY